jgi:hypothetical protein
MRTDASQTRTTGLSATTTLVALMAMATTCTAMAVPKIAHAPAESRPSMMEGQSVRYVAAAVAAIARDLFSSDHVEAALADEAWTEQYLPPITSHGVMPAADDEAIRPPLIEQHLDLPPPVC